MDQALVAKVMRQVGRLQAEGKAPAFLFFGDSARPKLDGASFLGGVRVLYGPTPEAAWLRHMADKALSVGTLTETFAAAPNSTQVALTFHVLPHGASRSNQVTVRVECEGRDYNTDVVVRALRPGIEEALADFLPQEGEAFIDMRISSGPFGRSSAMAGAQWPAYTGNPFVPPSPIPGEWDRPVQMEFQYPAPYWQSNWSNGTAQTTVNQHGNAMTQANMQRALVEISRQMTDARNNQLTAANNSTAQQLQAAWAEAEHRRIQRQIHPAFNPHRRFP